MQAIAHLNGLPLLGNALRVSRPNNYQPGDPMAACSDIDALVASLGAQPAGSAAAAATTATTAAGLRAAAAAATSVREAVLARAASSVVRYANIMAPEELLDEAGQHAHSSQLAVAHDLPFLGCGSAMAKTPPHHTTHTHTHTPRQGTGSAPAPAQGSGSCACSGLGSCASSGLRLLRLAARSVSLETPRGRGRPHCAASHRLGC